MAENPRSDSSSQVVNARAVNAKVLTVSELNRLARDVLERSFPLFWVSGEISNLTRAASGHWYFSLKDSGAQVRCVMFKNRNSYLEWIPKEGDKVEARAVVSFYEARGEFQLAIEFLQRAGLGALFEAYERLRLKLEREGLFDAAFKKTLPQHPRQIGIITSADAAALRDVLTTLKRRMPGIPVILYPTPVQGKGVANLIASAIDKASQHAECDVLILCRGGGSIEDLWQFNEEIVARAIHACQIPIISGVGHETDFTIADFVADYRAPTPTAAAELASPDRNNLQGAIMQLEQRISRQIRYLLENRSQQLDYLSRRLLSPMQQIRHKRDALAQLQSRLKTASTRQLQQQQQQLIQLGQNLQHLNPQAVLERGYAFVQNVNGDLISSSKQLKTGQRIAINFKDGKAEAEVNPASLF